MATILNTITLKGQGVTSDPLDVTNSVTLNVTQPTVGSGMGNLTTTVETLEGFDGTLNDNSKIYLYINNVGTHGGGTSLQGTVLVSVYAPNVAWNAPGSPTTWYDAPFAEVKVGESMFIPVAKLDGVTGADGPIIRVRVKESGYTTRYEYSWFTSI